jgi:Tfp pilus assembly protein PilV
MLINIMKGYKKSKGFLMIEVLIVASILTVSVLAAMSVAQKSISLSEQSLHTYQASFLLEEGAEAVRIVRDNSWSNISSLTSGTNYYPSFSGGTWTLSTIPNTIDIFTRTVNVQDVNRDNTTHDIVSSGGTLDSGTKLMTITVSWNEGGQSLSKTLSFYVMNIFS